MIMVKDELYISRHISWSDSKYIEAFDTRLCLEQRTQVDRAI